MRAARRIGDYGELASSTMKPNVVQLVIPTPRLAMAKPDMVIVQTVSFHCATTWDNNQRLC